MMPDNGSRPDSGAVDGSSSKADGGFDPPDAGTSSSAAPVVGFDSPDATASVDSSSSSTVNPNPDDNPFSEASDSVQPGFNDLMSNY
jgi:hypothetical protein